MQIRKGVSNTPFSFYLCLPIRIIWIQSTACYLHVVVDSNCTRCCKLREISMLLALQKHGAKPKRCFNPKYNSRKFPKKQVLTYIPIRHNLIRSFVRILNLAVTPASAKKKSNTPSSDRIPTVAEVGSIARIFVRESPWAVGVL